MNQPTPYWFSAKLFLRANAKGALKMARARNIKPAFFDNEYLAELPALNRLLFIGLWCLADREGRLEFRPKRIKAQLFPYDNCNTVEMLQALVDSGFITIYSSEGKDYIQIDKWSKHQNPHHKEIASVIPKPSNHTDSVCDGYIPMSNTLRNKAYKALGRSCICCGSKSNLEVDHIMPVSKGGNSILENLQILCKRCNVKKFNNFIDFKNLNDSNLSTVQAWFMNESSITKEQFKEMALWSTDSLNLIPDSLNLIPDTNEGEFEKIWESYGKKGNKKTSLGRFNRMTITNKKLMAEHLPKYILSKPDKQYRKNLETYINQECWNDEIEDYTNEKTATNQRNYETPTDRARRAGEELRRQQEAYAENNPSLQLDG